MNILIKGGRVLDPATKTDAILDVLVIDGFVVEINSHISKEADKIINAKGLWVTPGLIDMHVHLREPGFEHKETVATGSKSAAIGGFSTICCMPNTKPVTDNPGIVNYIWDKANLVGLVNVLPIGSITKNQDGVELSDMNGMAEVGICGVSEDGKTVRNAGVMQKGIKKAAKLCLPVLCHCEDADLGDGNLSEEIIAARDIMLAKGTGASLHLCHISTKGSVELLRLAKEKGIAVTAEAAPHHFTLSFEDAPTGDTNYKMNPPLRSKEDVLAIREALKDNTIQVIATDHAPHSADEKNVSYSDAPNGIVGLETAVPLTITNLVAQGYLTPLGMIEKMSFNPAKILGIEKGTLAIGKVADITIIDPELQYQISTADLVSKSKNSPFDGMNVKGKAIYTIVNGKIVMEMGSVIE